MGILLFLYASLLIDPNLCATSIAISREMRQTLKMESSFINVYGIGTINLTRKAVF